MKTAQFFLMLISVATIAMLTCGQTAVGQSQSFSFTSEEGEIFMFPEIGAIIQTGDEGLAVQMVMPPDQRDEKYKDIDLAIGDIIKMMNGKKVESIETVRTLYDSLKLEDEIKIAIMRDKKIHIIAFPKGEAGENMVMQTMTIKTDDQGEGGLEVNDGGKAMSFSGDVAIIHEIGLILSAEKGKLVVAGIMNMGEENRKAAGLKEGDQISSLQGEKMTSLDDFNKIYDNLKAGQEVKLECLQAGTIKAVSFVKADGAKKVIMKNK